MFCSPFLQAVQSFCFLRTYTLGSKKIKHYPLFSPPVSQKRPLKSQVSKSGVPRSRVLGMRGPLPQLGVGSRRRARSGRGFSRRPRLSAAAERAGGAARQPRGGISISTTVKANYQEEDDIIILGNICTSLKALAGRIHARPRYA